MSLTFYYAPMSTASMTDVVIHELGVPCERVKLDLKGGDGKKPEFLKVNPNAKVPAIVHEGTAIFESAAITLYLGEAFGVEKGLFPAPGPKRGEAMKWIVWSNVSLGDAVRRFTWNTMPWTGPADEKNEKAGERAKGDIAAHLKILDDALAGKEYLLGTYTLVDTHLHAFTDWIRSMHFDFAPYTNVAAWSQRCGARPAYQKVMSAGAHG